MRRGTLPGTPQNYIYTTMVTKPPTEQNNRQITPKSGIKRKPGVLTNLIMGALKEAGKEGLLQRELAARIGASTTDVSAWWATNSARGVAEKSGKGHGVRYAMKGIETVEEPVVEIGSTISAQGKGVLETMGLTVRRSGERAGKVRWTQPQREVLADAMISALMDFPLGPELETSYKLLNFVMSSNPVSNAGVPTRSVQGVHAYKTCGVHEAFVAKWKALMSVVTAPPTTIEKVVEVQQVIEMTPQEALQKLSLSEAVVALQNVINARMTPLHQIMDRIEKIASTPVVNVQTNVTVNTGSEIVALPEKKTRLKVAVVFSYHQRKHSWVPLKSELGPYLEIIDVLDKGDNKQISVSKAWDLVVIDGSVHSQHHHQHAIASAARDPRVNVPVQRCTCWAELEQYLRELAVKQKPSTN